MKEKVSSLILILDDKTILHHALKEQENLLIKNEDIDRNYLFICGEFGGESNRIIARTNAIVAQSDGNKNITGENCLQDNLTICLFPNDAEGRKCIIVLLDTDWEEGTMARDSNGNPIKAKKCIEFLKTLIETNKDVFIFVQIYSAQFEDEQLFNSLYETVANVLDGCSDRLVLMRNGFRWKLESRASNDAMKNLWKFIEDFVADYEESC